MANLKVIKFLVNDLCFAIPSVNVKEIKEIEGTVKKLFYERGGVLQGLINHEGEMISLIKTSVITGNENIGKEDQFILVCLDKISNTLAAISVSLILGIDNINTDNIKSAPEESENFISGFVREKNLKSEQVIRILDFGKFLDYTEAKIIENEKKL